MQWDQGKMMVMSQKPNKLVGSGWKSVTFMKMETNKRTQKYSPETRIWLKKNEGDHIRSFLYSLYCISQWDHLGEFIVKNELLLVSFLLALICIAPVRFFWLPVTNPWCLTGRSWLFRISWVSRTCWPSSKFSLTAATCSSYTWVTTEWF